MQRNYFYSLSKTALQGNRVGSHYSSLVQYVRANFKSFLSAVLDGKANPGEAVEAKKDLVVGAGSGLLKIEEIQLEGKKRMNAADFLRGLRELKKGSIFSSA